MAKIDQLPAELHVEIVSGDFWRISVDFDIDLTGFDIAARIVVQDGEDPISLTVDEVNLSLGQFDILLPASASAGILQGYHSWCLVMTAPFVDPELPEPRTYFSGRFIVT